MPDVPKPQKLPPAIRSDVGRLESNRMARKETRRKRQTSSYRGSIRGGAVNPAYQTGTKTAQGQ